jgi:hypothetical protein
VEVIFLNFYGSTFFGSLFPFWILNILKF